MWFLIFERSSTHNSPGASFVSGMAAGSGATRAPQWRAFKSLMILEADSWQQALERAVKLTGTLGEYAAVECNVFVPDMLKMAGE